MGFVVSRHLVRAVVAVLVLGSATLATAPAAMASVSTGSGTCAVATTTFNGATYCPATIAGVRKTAYGTGTRVVLKGVTVTAVTTGTVTLGAWAAPACAPNTYCGATMTLQTLTVSWSGKNRPAPGDVLNLFGSTVPTSLTPVGYLKTGYCPIEYC
jgi:hypothetical protein